jgi:hypothetical protein
MKAHVDTTPTITLSPWFRRNATALIAVALIAVATLGAGLARALYTSASSLPAAPAISVESSTPLDQHERHPAAFASVSTPLDQHERHPASFVTSADTSIYAPLDQHERHPLFSTGRPTPSERDMWWAER